MLISLTKLQILRAYFYEIDPSGLIMSATIFCSNPPLDACYGGALAALLP